IDRRLGFCAEDVRAAEIAPLPAHAAGRNESARIHHTTFGSALSDRHVEDRILDLVPEKRRRSPPWPEHVVEPALYAEQLLGFERFVGLGDVVAHAQRAYLFVVRRCAEAA